MAVGRRWQLCSSGREQLKWRWIVWSLVTMLESYELDCLGSCRLGFTKLLQMSRKLQSEHQILESTVPT
eukprot:3137678-Amphidinium_carterae.1